MQTGKPINRFHWGRPAARSGVLAALLTLAALGSAWALETGDAAPTFTLPGTAGAINLADYKGKVVYLDFWASWCGPCKQSFPWMNVLQAKFGPQGLKIIAVNVDANTADGQRFLASVPAAFDIALDPKGILARQYAIKGMPSSLVIGRDGKIVGQHTGFNDASRVKVEASIQSAIGASL